jgi:hypothetical protein
MKRLTRLFTAWKGGRAARGTAPPPDPNQPVRIDGRGEKLVEVLSSDSGRHRVGITRDSAGIYRLRVETWAPDWEEMGVATWLQLGSAGTFTDSLERARELAVEHLSTQE